MPSFNPTITGCVLARNEAHRIEDALLSLRGLADQIIVIDNESTDDTVAIARRYADLVMSAPRAANLDGVRNLAIERATGDWFFVLDPDERVPGCLHQALLKMIREHGHEFEAVCIPFKHFFCGKWMEHSGWWPGYTRPQLLKKGYFRYNERLHSGVHVDGRTMFFPADDPQYAILHYSYDNLTHYLTKLNAYTDGEAENLLANHQSHSWQAQLAHFTLDWQNYYERERADLDGMHGFILSFCSAFYRFVSRAKLWDLRRQRGELVGTDPVPLSVRDMLVFMVGIAQNGPEHTLAPSPLQHLFIGDRVPQEWLPRQADEKAWDGPTTRGEKSGISACIVARNEEKRIEPALRSLQGWVDRIVVVDNGSTDRTAEIARRYTPHVLSEPPAANFEEVRLRAAPRVEALVFETGDWLLYLDADERVPAVLAEAICCLVRDHSSEFDALCLPFRNYFYGKWMQGGAWWPGYKGPQLLKKHTYRHGEQIHSGTRIAGRMLYFPNHDPELAIRHEAYDTITHYIAKLNAYTTPGSEEQSTQSHSWQAQLASFAWDWKVHYEDGNAQIDGMHGFIHSFLCAFYRFMTHAKLWDLRRQCGQTVAQEPVPASLGEMLQFMGQVLHEGPGSWLSAPQELQGSRPLPVVEAESNAASVSSHRTKNRQSDRTEKPNGSPPISPPANPVALTEVSDVDFHTVLGRPLRVRWEGDQFIRSSLAHVNRELCLGLLAPNDVELSVIANRGAWHTLTARDDPRFEALERRLGARLSGPPDIVIRHHFPPNWKRPEAGKLIVIQPWELSHLPEQDWIAGATQSADDVWAYSRFVRDIYARSGVPAEKVHIVPLGVRSEIFHPSGPATLPPRLLALMKPEAREAFAQAHTRFLYVGGTTDRKGADLLLRAYLDAFTATDDVCLIYKDMGTRTFYQIGNLGPTLKRVQEDTAAPQVLYFEDDLSEQELAMLYRSCTCVVLPYRGEGFGLSPLEGMACGLPAIVTSAGATDDYLDDTMALRVPHHRCVMPGFYKGAGATPFDPWKLEPDYRALVDALRWVHTHPEESAQRGKAAHAHVAAGWSWKRSAKVARSRLMAMLDVPARPFVPAKTWFDPAAGLRTGMRVRDGRKVQLSLCMIARDEEERIGSALSSIAPYVDEMIVVDTGSLDRTREIARDAGARVFEFPWTDSFADARNQSIALARGDWIFWMDADETISPESAQMLRELIHKHPSRDVAYQAQIHIPKGPGEYGVSIVDHVRLFPNLPKVRFEHRIHEQILPSLRQSEIEIHSSEVYLTHSNYDRSPAGRARTRKRDFHLLYLDLADHPDHPSVMFNLGMTYLFSAKDYEIAAHYLSRSLGRSNWRDSIVRKAYGLLTTARMAQQDWQEALRVNEEGREHYPEDADLLFLAGQIYQHVGAFEEARQALESLLNGQDDIHYRSANIGLRTYRGQHELALLRMRMGDFQNCLQMLQSIVSTYPDYLPAQKDYGSLRQAAEVQLPA